uniref:C-type lectin domain-containing protein n=1 Tax=Strix occidentalis caurina TaxID=311401 RepID=A0A8D0FUM1_STROC
MLSATSLYNIEICCGKTGLKEAFPAGLIPLVQDPAFWKQRDSTSQCAMGRGEGSSSCSNDGEVEKALGPWDRGETPTELPGDRKKRTQRLVGECGWVGHRGVCYYLSSEEGSWEWSQERCSSLEASLAVLKDPEELDFLLRYGRSIHYWVGLRREGSAPWKWFDGSFLNSSFPVRGDGQCAYINHDGISSDWCSQKKYSVCSHPQKRRGRVQESKILLNST